MTNIRSKKILIIPGTDFLRAYSGTLYLIKSLQHAEVTINIWIRCSKEDSEEYAKLKFPCKIFIKKNTQILFFDRISSFTFKILIFLRMLIAKQVIITESTYLREAALVKKIKGNFIKLIQFCQELHIPEEYPGWKLATLYEKYAQVPDMVIDVEPNRARIRKERFRLKAQPIVLFNTIPIDNLPLKAPIGTLALLADIPLTNSLPILLHMGGIGVEKPLERVIDAIAYSKSNIFFVAFCNGPINQIEELRKYAESKLVTNCYRILQAKPREILLASAWEADIGIIDYAFSVQPSSNQRFCAPTKLYEFLALGLAVLCSSNESLKNIVENERVGICSATDKIEDLGIALRNLINAQNELPAMKIRAKKVFIEKYSYDKLCYSVINEKIINGILN